MRDDIAFYRWGQAIARQRSLSMKGAAFIVLI